MIFDLDLNPVPPQNIFMAVIIDAYEKLQEMVDWKLSPQMLDDFVWAWAEYDDGSGTISPESFLMVSACKRASAMKVWMIQAFWTKMGITAKSSGLIDSAP